MTMNKSFALLLTLVFFSLTLNAQDIYRVTADNLRVRETNNINSKIIGFLPQDENVAVLDSTDAKYFKVKMTDGEGWASSEFLTRVSPAPVKKAQPAVKLTAPTMFKSDSNLVFVSIVAFILLGMLFLIFKYLKNVPLMIFFALIILAMGYFSFTMLLLQKKIVGKYFSSEDLQYPSFDFKSKDSVVVLDAYADSTFAASYEIEGDMIKFKQQENTFMLMIRDESTLIGEGFTKGVFKKN